MDIPYKPGTDDDLKRLMATDRLAVVCKASADPQQVLQHANEILKEKEAPIALDNDPLNEQSSESLPVYTVVVNGENLSVWVLPFATQRSDGSQELISEEEVLQSVMALDEALTNPDSPLSKDVISVSPNWLTVSSPPDQSGFGGPGARPSTLDVTNTPPYHVRFYPRNVDANNHVDTAAREALQALLSNTEADNITIVVLDTSPDAGPFSALAGHADNKLMSSLAGCLTIHTDAGIDEELRPFSEIATRVYARGHDYNMESHGIFVAGLIHSIIPKAQIHLIRVLNDHGIGTVHTVQRGLEIAMTLGTASVPLIINFSLTLTFPDADAAGNTTLPEWLQNWSKIWEDLSTEKEELLRLLESYGSQPRPQRVPVGLPTTLPERLRYAMELTVRTAYQQGALMIAAAGNERQPGEAGLPLTQYPAAFDDVIGVGALESIAPNADPATLTSVRFAPYSCSVDKPAEEGFAVLGGNTTGTTPLVADSDKGIVGLWLDSATAPEKCWRRWAGTSFAAPIMTGALALLLAQGTPRAAALQMLYDGWPERISAGGRVNTPQVVIARQE